MTKHREKILVVAEDPPTQHALISPLASEYELSFVEEAVQGYRIAREQKPQLVILDAKTPGMGIVELCILLKKSDLTRAIPVVVLVDQEDSDLQVEVLESGADDVIEMPVLPVLLRARIARRIGKSHRIDERSSHLLTRGNLQLDQESYDCFVADSLVRLSVLEFNLLRFFMENFTRVLTREDILRKVWGDEDISQRTIDTHIAGLRKKIQRSDLAFVSFYGVGYSLRMANTVVTAETAKIS